MLRDRGSMSWLSKELVFVILQYVDEEKFSETIHNSGLLWGGQITSTPHFNSVSIFHSLIAFGWQWPLIFKYRVSVRTQSPKVEMIDSLYKKVSDTKDDGIMRELLLEFYTSSGKRKPDQIVIFSYVSSLGSEI
ncbi:hypothetical protein FNV43_RR00563 [Rhamnella rubrinervis]|uniref:Uncharacterized protein n=1 Tax=Rhamnella rubrinervis TaxID=2594499 RepID=A0A8K0HNW7_9ROSA|nr:hypothetical protein FNV43_RR00563 [Rhamnella rubrinervis]